MKILVITQRYWPENFRITDIAEELVARGHDVTVLTGLPNYPKGYLFDDYKKGKNRLETHNGVKIIRCHEIERRHGVVFRFLNYYSFAFSSKRMIKKLDKDFDVILFNELSPIMSGYAALKYKKKHNTKILMYEMDLWPESLTAGGIKNSSIIFKHYANVSKKVYSGCDKILVSTFEHIKYIKELLGNREVSIDYLPQYAEKIFEDFDGENIKNDKIDVVFAGNIGKAQSVELIVKAAKILENEDKYLFHIVGDGSELDNCKKLAKEFGLKNIVFYGSRPMSEMPEFYRLADIMLVTLENKPYANMTIPGKVQSYMAFGKPIISVTNGATNNLIQTAECGISISSDSPNELAEVLLSVSKEDIKKYSYNSLNYYNEHFRRELFFEKLICELEKLANKN